MSPRPLSVSGAAGCCVLWHAGLLLSSPSDPGTNHCASLGHRLGPPTPSTSAVLLTTPLLSYCFCHLPPSRPHCPSPPHCVDPSTARLSPQAAGQRAFQNIHLSYKVTVPVEPSVAPKAGFQGSQRSPRTSKLVSSLHELSSPRFL